MDLFYLTIRYLRKPLRSSPIYPLYRLRHIFFLSLSFSQLISYDYSKIITYDLSYDIDVQWIRKFIERSKDRLLYSSYIFYEAAMIFFRKEQTLFLLVWPIVWNSTSKVLLFFLLSQLNPHPSTRPNSLGSTRKESIYLPSIFLVPHNSMISGARNCTLLLYFTSWTTSLPRSFKPSPSSSSSTSTTLSIFPPRKSLSWYLLLAVDFSRMILDRTERRGYLYLKIVKRVLLASAEFEYI